MGIVALVVGLTFYMTTQPQYIDQFASKKSFLYVSSDGSDENNGSKKSPFRTIGKATSIATSGTTVVVGDGYYNETVITKISGEPSTPIVFLSENPYGAKIMSSGNDESTQATWENNGNYVEISGFDVSGGQRIGILNRGSFVKIHGNRVHDIATGFCENLGGAGIDSAYSEDQQGNEYFGNLVENIGPKPCSYVHGIYIQSNNEKVFNNIVVNAGGIGIACTHGCNSPLIANNTLLNNGYGIRIGWSLSSPTGTTNNAVVSNNIIVGSLNYSIYQYLTGLGNNNSFTNNLFYGNRINTCSSPTGTTPIECSNSVYQDPQLVNYDTDGNYGTEIDAHLSSTSPAIDAGISLGVVTKDFDNVSRPQGEGYDIGAFEFGYNDQTRPSNPNGGNGRSAR